MVKLYFEDNNTPLWNGQLDVSRHEHNRKPMARSSKSRLREGKTVERNMNKLKNGNYNRMGKNIKGTYYEALSYITSAKANDYNRKKNLEVLQNIKY